MTKRHTSKHKIDRRLGENLWGRGKSPLNHTKTGTATGPGQHGARRKTKLSDFGTQLMAKQKLKGFYGNITERQFRRVYAEASRLKGDTGENMIGLLESRLDAIVYRAKFAPTVFAARQLVSHGHVRVNGKRVTVASYSCKPNDVIALSDKARDMALVISAGDSPERNVPDYVEIAGKGQAKYTRVPKLSDVPYAVIMNPNLIVEFYSR